MSWACQPNPRSGPFGQPQAKPSEQPLQPSARPLTAPETGQPISTAFQDQLTPYWGLGRALTTLRPAVVLTVVLTVRIAPTFAARGLVVPVQDAGLVRVDRPGHEALRRNEPGAGQDGDHR